MFVKKLLSGKRKFVFLAVFSVSMVVIGLGVTPNYSCGCGGVENGTKLTYLINGVSKSIIGKPVIEVKKGQLN